MMNDRIKDLAEQVYGTAHYDDFKFAELIIKECANVVKDFYQEDGFTCYNAAEEIKDHFGVK